MAVLHNVSPDLVLLNCPRGQLAHTDCMSMCSTCLELMCRRLRHLPQLLRLQIIKGFTCQRLLAEGFMCHRGPSCTTLHVCPGQGCRSCSVPAADHQNGSTAQVSLLVCVCCRSLRM